MEKIKSRVRGRRSGAGSTLLKRLRVGLLEERNIDQRLEGGERELDK